MYQTREPPTLRHRNNHLPYDVVLKILGQLPVKSVMRLRCVSKSLYSSIASPDFISTHLNNININNNNINHDNAHVIHIESESTRATNRQVCMVALARTFDRISEIGVPFDFPTKCVQIVGSCNGLLCLADYPPGNVVYLWNPSTRRFKKLSHTCLGLLKHVTLGFAYCSENNDYKVVRTSGSSLSTSEIEMYTLSSDSWKRVEISVTTDVIFCKNLVSPIPFVSGALHWMSSVKEENRMTETDIMAFDVNSEKFRKLALPHGSIDGPLLQRCVASFRGKLAFFEESGFQYSIWVMGDYGVVESWNKLFVVPFERVSCWISLTDYGSLMVWYRNDRAEGQGFEHALIDIETLQEKKDPDIQHPSYVATFMESLVLLDGTNVESYYWVGG
uniref:F-box domain-containing protein n=2 Tax=Quercus lobata TaxID=97700 RepID=A0A7N2R363_QUELO